MNRIVSQGDFIKVIIKYPRTFNLPTKELKCRIRPWMTAAELMCHVRSLVKLDSTKGVFLMCKSMIVCGTQLIGQIHNNHKNKRDELELALVEENVFG